jgi:RNA polymerase sigma-70 factor, ECF subfamily
VTSATNQPDGSAAVGAQEPRAVDDGHVSAAQGGDEAAFVLLYRHVHPRLCRYLKVLVGAEAEDVAAETWIHVCRDLHSFSGGLDDFRGWVTRIGRNRALDHLRLRERRPSVPVPPEDLWFLGGGTDVAEEVVDILGTAQALSLVASLPREQAEAVMLRVVLELDAKSAGAVVGRSPGAIRTAAYRGLRRLALILDQPEAQGPKSTWHQPPEAS